MIGKNWKLGIKILTVLISTVATFTAAQTSFSQTKPNNSSATSELERITILLAVSSPTSPTKKIVFVGSGVIVAHNNSKYYLLTNKHVTKDNDNYLVVIPPSVSGQSKKEIYPVRVEYQLANADMAIVSFVDSKNIVKDSNIATSIQNFGLINQGNIVYIAGWPDSEQVARFTESSGTLKEFVLLGTNQQLVYTNKTERGMSGGPILLDPKLDLIGIHQRGDGRGVPLSVIDDNLRQTARSGAYPELAAFLLAYDSTQEYIARNSLPPNPLPGKGEDNNPKSDSQSNSAITIPPRTQVEKILAEFQLNSFTTNKMTK